jgi:hypothetical protein
MDTNFREGKEFNAKAQSGGPQPKPELAAKEHKVHKDFNRRIRRIRGRDSNRIMGGKIMAATANECQWTRIENISRERTQSGKPQPIDFNHG